MANPEMALRWVVEILRKHEIPFQITGGLAARAYGATRPLNDIDIDIPENRFDEIINEVSPYIIYGPAQFIDTNWNLYLMTLDYHRQKIDICGAYKVKVRKTQSSRWRTMPADLSKFERKKFFGFEVPVITKEELIQYKTIIGRKVDQQDIDLIPNSRKL